MPNDQPTYDEIRRVLGVPPEDFDDDQLKVLRRIAAGMQWFRSIDIMAHGLADAIDAEFEAAARRWDAAPDSTRALPDDRLRAEFNSIMTPGLAEAVRAESVTSALAWSVTSSPQLLLLLPHLGD